MKRLFLLLLAVALPVSSVLFIASPASATSDYDESYKNTDSLMLSLDGRESIDVTLNWNSFITGAYTEKNLIYRNGNNTATEAEINAWRDSYNNKQYWSVSQRCETSNYCFVYVVWSTSNNMSLTWQTNGVLISDNSDIYVAELNYNTGNSNNVDVYINKTSVRRVISMPSINISNLFAFVSDYNYPTGYEGEEIPQEINELPIVRPDFTYTINSKDVTSKDRKKDLPEITPDEGYTIAGYSVEWSLFHCPDGWDPVSNTCTNDSNLIDHQILLQSSDYQYTVSKFGHYYIQANYLVKQCYDYGGGAEPYCFYVDLQTELSDYDFTSTTAYLNIDGTSFSGDTIDGDCDTSGFCAPPSPYEDCSVYGIENIIGGITCVLNNFGTFIGLLLKQLFTPNFGVLSDEFTKTQTQLTNKLGFLVLPFSFTLNLLTSTIGAIVTPTCSTNFGQVFNGGQFSLNACALEDNFPTAFNTFQTLLMGVTGFTLLSAIYVQYRRVIS